MLSLSMTSLLAALANDLLKSVQPDLSVRWLWRRRFKTCGTIDSIQFNSIRFYILVPSLTRLIGWHDIDSIVTASISISIKSDRSQFVLQ